MDDEIRGLLMLSVFLGLVGDIALIGSTLWCVRVGFGRYLRENFPDRWERLQAEKNPRVGLMIQADASVGVARYRKDKDVVIEEPELRRRRDWANRMERIVLYGWLLLALWMVIVVVLIASID